MGISNFNYVYEPCFSAISLINFTYVNLKVKAQFVLYYMQSWLYLIWSIISVLQTIVVEDVAAINLFQRII